MAFRQGSVASSGGWHAQFQSQALTLAPCLTQARIVTAAYFASEQYIEQILTKNCCTARSSGESIWRRVPPERKRAICRSFRWFAT